MNKYILYCRKSSEEEDRQILSIESQDRELRTLAERYGLEIVLVLHEAKSAHKRGRPIFNGMMGRIEHGEGNSLLVWQPNRLARNAYDGGWIITLMDEGKISEIRTPFRTYSNTPEDKFFLQLEFGMAKKDSDDKSLNVLRGLKTKVLKGWRPGVAPLGYLNDKTKERGERDIIPDPERFPLVRSMWDMMLEGAHSVRKIQNIANSELGLRTRPMRREGRKPLSLSHIYRIFTDPFYYGCFYWNKELVKGSHHPMITEEEYDRVQVLLGRKGKPRLKKRAFPFTGMIRCGECGAMITAEEKNQIICSECKYKFSYLNRDECPRCRTSIEGMRNPKILCYIYYHCTKRKDLTCSQGSISGEELEEDIKSYLGKIHISEAFKDWAIPKLRKAHSKEKQTQEKIFHSLQRAYNECVKKLHNLFQLKISSQNSDGSLLSDDEFREEKSRLLEEKGRLEEKLRDRENRVEEWLENAEKTYNFARYVPYWFANGDLQAKKQILELIGSNLILKGKKLSLELKNPFFSIEEGIRETPQAKAGFEPAINGLTKRKREVEFDKIPNLLRGWNDVRTWWIENLWTDEGFATHLLLKQLFQALKLKEKLVA